MKMILGIKNIFKVYLGSNEISLTVSSVVCNTRGRSIFSFIFAIGPFGPGTPDSQWLISAILKILIKKMN